MNKQIVVAINVVTRERKIIVLVVCVLFLVVVRVRGNTEANQGFHNGTKSSLRMKKKTFSNDGNTTIIVRYCDSSIY